MSIKRHEQAWRLAARGARCLQTRFVSRDWPRGFDVPFALYCVVLLTIAPFMAIVLLTLWFYSRAGQRTVGSVFLSLVVSYLYLVYAFANGTLASGLLALSLLAVLNVIALRTKLSHEDNVGVLVQRIAALEKLATHDELTAVYCRRHICELGRREFNRSRRSGRRFGAMLVGVDRLPEINDRYGYAVGDKALVTLAATMQACLRSQDLPGRYAGDEFLVLLPDTGPAGAISAADRLRRAIKFRPVIDGDVQMLLSVSIGIAGLDGQSGDLQCVVDRAEFALHDARTRGRDQVRSWPGLEGRRGPASKVHEMTG